MVNQRHVAKSQPLNSRRHWQQAKGRVSLTCSEEAWPSGNEERREHWHPYGCRLSGRDGADCWLGKILQKYMSKHTHMQMLFPAHTVWVCRDSRGNWWAQTFTNSSNQILYLCSHRWFSLNCLVPSLWPNYEKWLNLCVGYRHIL